MKQWQPLGWDRWWMEGSRWLCWVAALSLSFLPLPPPRAVSPFLSLSLPLALSVPFSRLIHVQVSLIFSTDEWWREHLSCLCASFLTLRVSASPAAPLFGLCTIYRTSVGQMRVRRRRRQWNKQTCSEMDKGGKGVENKREVAGEIEKRSRERKGNQCWLEWWDHALKVRLNQWWATGWDFIWHPCNLYPRIPKLMICNKLPAISVLSENFHHEHKPNWTTWETSCQTTLTLWSRQKVTTD